MSRLLGRPKVLYVLTTLDVGGAERSLLELLRRIDRERLRPIVCSLMSGGALRRGYESLGIPVVEFGVGPGLAEASGLRLVTLLMRLRPQIVHSRLILSNLWARWGAAFGAKVICEERGLADTRPAFMTRLNRLTQPLCAMNVANSQAVAARMRSRDGISDQRLRVIYGGVDCERFVPSARGAAKSFDIVTTTRLERYKGVFDFLQAIRLVNQERPGTRVSILGGGSQRSALEQTARDLGLTQSVVFWGEQSDVPSRLHEASVFALSSHEEGLPNAVIEAMACGLPVAATRVGGTAELVENGSTGILVPPRDPPSMASALLRYLDSPALAHAHGDAGRVRAETCFDIRGSAHAYERLYAELMG